MCAAAEAVATRCEIERRFIAAASAAAIPGSRTYPAQSARLDCPARLRARNYRWRCPGGNSLPPSRSDERCSREETRRRRIHGSRRYLRLPSTPPGQALGPSRQGSPPTSTGCTPLGVGSTPTQRGCRPLAPGSEPTQRGSRLWWVGPTPTPAGCKIRTKGFDIDHVVLGSKNQLVHSHLRLADSRSVFPTRFRA